MNQRLKVLALVPALLLLNACATSRSTLALGLPDQGTVVTGNKVAVIETVIDQRTFETDPDDPSIPSLKQGEKYALDADARKKAIARKRNTYGMALGDIVLEGDATVESLSRELVAQGLRERGFQVLPEGQPAPEGSVTLRVGVQEFWAWWTPGFWAATIEAKIRTSIDTSTGQTIEVGGYGENVVQTGRDLNWQQAYDRAFADYRAKLAAALQAAGL